MDPEEKRKEMYEVMGNIFEELNSCRCSVISCCEECDEFLATPFPSSVCEKLNKFIERKEGEKFDPDCPKDNFAKWGDLWKEVMNFYLNM